MRPHHTTRRQKTLPVQPAAAAAAAVAAAVGMTLYDVLRGTYHAGTDRLQEVGGRAVRRRPRRSIVVGLNSKTLLGFNPHFNINLMLNKDSELCTKCNNSASHFLCLSTT